MNPTLLYNNYYIQRRKMFQSSPRNNLYSTVDITWRQSIDPQLSPKQKMERKKEAEMTMIGERSNQLIAKRLKKEVFVDSEVWRSMKEDREGLRKGGRIDNGGGNGHRRSASVYDNYNITNNRSQRNSRQNMDHLKDTLNQQVQNYYSSNKIPNQTNRRHINQQPSHHLHPQQNHYNNYTRHFDPQLQSLASRQSMASSELSELIPKGNGYLGKFLGKKLEKYLLEGRSSRERSFGDFETIEHDRSEKM